MVDINKLNDFLGIGVDGQYAVGVLTLTRKSGKIGIIPIGEEITFNINDLFYISATNENPAEIGESQNFVPYAVKANNQGTKYNLAVNQTGWQADRLVDFTIQTWEQLPGGLMLYHLRSTGTLQEFLILKSNQL